MRRTSRPVGALALAALTVALAACTPTQAPGPASSAPSASPPTSSSESSSAPDASPTNSTSAGSPSRAADVCLTKARSLSRAERAGQVLMLGHGASTPVGPETTKRLRDAHIGSVLLLENTQMGVSGVRELTDNLRTAAPTPGGMELIVAADQEGGLVQRLQGPGFDTIPAASAQAELGDKALARDAETWGRQLRKAGVDVDFAPVADVVPPAYRSSNEPIALLKRGYGSDPGVVGAKVSAFVRGMDAAGVATSVKHFPGIGAVRGNTDFSANVRDTTTSRRDARSGGFEAGVTAGADLVMVSTVTYTKIDAEHQAVFSPTVMQMVRRDLDFDGVIVSDDLGAAKAVAAIDPGQRAVRFLEAGGDLVINADPALINDMAAAVRAEMADDPDFDAAVTRSTARVLRLKDERGLGSCG